MPSYQFVEIATTRKLFVLNLEAQPAAPEGIAVSLDDGKPVWTPPREKSETHKLIDQLEIDGILTALRATRCRAAIDALKLWP